MSTEKFKLKGTKYVIEKDPNSVLDYTVDFTDFLDPVNDDIASLTVTATGGLVVDSSLFTAKTAVAWLSGGTLTVAGDYASATYRITTSNTPPRTEDRTIWFDVKER
jgi:hypothetical protein